MLPHNFSCWTTKNAIKNLITIAYRNLFLSKFAHFYNWSCVYLILLIDQKLAAIFTILFRYSTKIKVCSGVGGGGGGTQVEVCVNNQTIKNARGGGG